MDTYKTIGIDRVMVALTNDVYEQIMQFGALPKDLNSQRTLQDAIKGATIGQLYALTQLQFGLRWKTFKILHVESDGNIMIEISGLYGCMDIYGFIHT